MARIMFITLTKRERDNLLRVMPGAYVLDNANTAEETLAAFTASEDGVLLATATWARQGFRVPHDTQIMIGPGLDSADQLQIFARAR